MNFDNNPVNISASLDSAVLAYKQNQFDRSEAECKRLLQANPNNANALYLYGLVLQKKGNNNLAIDYINKAISSDAAQIGMFQSKLLEPVQNDMSVQFNNNQQFTPQISSPQISDTSQTDDDPFKATRELLKRFEREQSIESNQTIGGNQQSSWSTMKTPQSQGVKSFADNSGLVAFIQKLYAQNFSANVLFWTEVESKTIGNLNQFPGMKFSVWHDEIKSHEYYTDFLKDLKLRSMSVITDDKVLKTQWDAFIIPYTAIDCAQDPIQSISYQKLYLANGFMNAPDRQNVEAKLKSKGCVPISGEPCVFERKDLLSKGEMLYNEGKVEEAIQCFEEILASDPNNTDAYNNLGVISYALGYAQSAETFLLKALEIDSNHVNALMNLADVYCASGHVNEAAKYMTKAIELEPKNPAIWISLSNFYKRIGSQEESHAALKKSEDLKRLSDQ